MPGPAPPVPYTWRPGNIVSAALLNSQLQAGLTYLLNPPHFVVRQSTAQAFTTGTNTNVSWDTVDTDPYSGFNSGVDPTRYVVQAAGWYVATYVICWANNTAGNRSVFLQRNGSSLPGSWSSAAPSNSYPTVSGTFRVQCAAGDYLQVAAQQGSGGSLSTANPGVGQSWWSLRWDHA